MFCCAFAIGERLLYVLKQAQCVFFSFPKPLFLLFFYVCFVCFLGFGVWVGFILSFFSLPEYCVCVLEDQKQRTKATQTKTTTTHTNDDDDDACRKQKRERERERERQIIYAITKEAFFSTRKSSTTTTNHLLHHSKRSRIRRLRIWARRCRIIIGSRLRTRNVSIECRFKTIHEKADETGGTLNRGDVSSRRVGKNWTRSYRCEDLPLRR